MPEPTEKKTITFNFRWFWGTCGTVLIVATLGFWRFYEHEVGLHLDSARREHSVRIENLENQYQAKVRELELTGQAALLHSEEASRRRQESLEAVIDTLRQKLSTSRSTLELSVSGEFISVADLLLDEAAARDLMATGDRTNIKRLVVPEFSAIGWQKFDDIALAQVAAYVKDSTLRLRPDGVSEDQIDWQPILTLWGKETKRSVGAVAVGQLSKEEFAEFLRRGGETTSKYVRTDSEGNKTEYTETITLDVSRLEDTPIGISAYPFLFFAVFANDPFSRSEMKITSFSARSDAMHFSGTVLDEENRRFAIELLVMQDAGDTFVFITTYHSRDALDPIAQETSDWMSGVRIVRKPRS